MEFYFYSQLLMQYLDLASRCSFHADLQGGEASSYGSSDDSRGENIDVMSVHSDTALTAARETLSLADYALTDEDALSDNSDRRLRRQTSAIIEVKSSLLYNQASGVSRSLESLNTASSDYGSLRHHPRTRYPTLQSKEPRTVTSGKKEVSNNSGLEVPPRNTSNRNNPSARPVYKRSKSEGGSGSCLSNGGDKLPQKRLLPTLR